MSDAEKKYQAMEKYYQCIIKEQQEEIKSLKLQIAKQSDKLTTEYESEFEKYLKMVGYEKISKN